MVNHVCFICIYLLQIKTDLTVDVVGSLEDLSESMLKSSDELEVVTDNIREYIDSLWGKSNGLIIVVSLWYAPNHYSA